MTFSWFFLVKFYFIGNYLLHTSIYSSIGQCGTVGNGSKACTRIIEYWLRKATLVNEGCYLGSTLSSEAA
jgi:hypothetical protein